MQAILPSADVQYSIVYHYFSKGIVFARLQRASNIFGLAALGCFNIILIFSTSFWRKKAYNVFAKIHILGYVTAVPAVSAFFRGCTYLNDRTTRYIFTVHQRYRPSLLSAQCIISTSFFVLRKRASSLQLYVPCLHFLQHALKFRG